jgi:hypothetical protein
MAEQAQQRRHALDRGLQVARRLEAAGMERRADVDQVPQHGQLGARAALHMAAVSEDLAIEGPLQQDQALVRQGFRARQAR